VQKFVNPKGLIGFFEGSAVEELANTGGNPHRLPVKVQLQGNPRGIDPAQHDAFNVLDFFILSDELCDFIDRVTNRSWPRRRAFVFWNGRQLDRAFSVLLVDISKSLGVLKATAADWTPDARYPVKVDALGLDDMALDAELKFPVISNALVDAILSEGFKAQTVEYPGR
jgi:hypothetical protein